jgi:thiamine monophosphate synthase
LLLPADLPVEAARAAVKRIQAADRPALVIDDLDRRTALQADGVHLTDAARVRAVRAKLGDGLALGAECPLERHACMVAAEDGADYVAVRVTAENVEDAEELLAWWHEMMTTPIVALVDAPIENRSAARLRGLRVAACFLMMSYLLACCSDVASGTASAKATRRSGPPGITHRTDSRWSAPAAAVRCRPTAAATVRASTTWISRIT